MTAFPISASWRRPSSGWQEADAGNTRHSAPNVRPWSPAITALTSARSIASSAGGPRPAWKKVSPRPSTITVATRGIIGAESVYETVFVGPDDDAGRRMQSPGTSASAPDPRKPRADAPLGHTLKGL